MLTLFHSPTSPYVRKVVVALHETGLIDRVKLVEASGNPLSPGSMPTAENPLGKIPTLVRDDGPALFDSRVITRYVSDLAGGKLYPAAPRLWETLTLEAMADGISDAGIVMIYELRVRPSESRSDAWIEGQWGKVARALDQIESRWMANLAGPVDCAQIALACALGYLDLRFSDRGWRDSRPALAAWEATFAQRPSMQATRPTG